MKHLQALPLIFSLISTSAFAQQVDPGRPPLRTMHGIAPERQDVDAATTLSRIRRPPAQFPIRGAFEPHVPSERSIDPTPRPTPPTAPRLDPRPMLGDPREYPELPPPVYHFYPPPTHSGFIMEKRHSRNSTSYTAFPAKAREPQMNNFSPIPYTPGYNYPYGYGSGHVAPYRSGAAAEASPPVNVNVTVNGAPAPSHPAGASPADARPPATAAPATTPTPAVKQTAPATPKRTYQTAPTGSDSDLAAPTE